MFREIKLQKINLIIISICSLLRLSEEVKVNYPSKDPYFSKMGFEDIL